MTGDAIPRKIWRLAAAGRCFGLLLGLIMTFRSFLAASALSLAALGSASAQNAPLPQGDAQTPAIDYVRFCDTIGVGFYIIPGTDTCLRVGGFVRADLTYINAVARNSDDTVLDGRGRLEFDARTLTDVGTLRSFLRVDYRYNNAGPNTGTNAVDKAFINFIGITAGMTSSFFDFDPNANLLLFQRVSDRGATPLFAYEAAIMDGIKVAISAESNQNRRLLVTSTTAPTAADYEPKVPFPSPAPTITTNLYSGNEFPDFVARVLVEQAWGQFQLSAASHQVDPVIVGVDTQFGYAVQGGLKILLPMIQAGDFVNFHAAYADGAMSYLGYSSNRVSSGTMTSTDTVVGVRDAVVNLSTKTMSTSSGYTIAGSFTHFWTPAELRSTFAVSYSDVDQALVASSTNATPVADFTELVASANLIWTPTRQIVLGPEIQYRRVDLQDGIPLPSTRKNADDEWAFRFRAQRSF